MRTKSPWSEKQQLHRDRRQELWAWMERERVVGEAIWNTARRLLMQEALSACPTQKAAAAVLGCSERCITYYKHQAVERRLRKVK